MTTEHLQLLATIIGGASALIVSLLYYKENKRYKNAQSNREEIESLNEALKALRQEKNEMKIDYDAKFKCMQHEIDRLKEDNSKKSTDLRLAEKNALIYDRALECRIKCHQKDCPVENKLNELIKK